MRNSVRAPNRAVTPKAAATALLAVERAAGGVRLADVLRRFLAAVGIAVTPMIATISHRAFACAGDCAHLALLRSAWLTSVAHVAAMLQLPTKSVRLQYWSVELVR